MSWDFSTKDYSYRPTQNDEGWWACNCVGPQNGQPVCPCQMRSVQIKDGRYIKVIDYGPAPKEKS